MSTRQAKGNQGASTAGAEGAAQTARRHLVTELADARESLVQACWAHQIWRTAKLRTTDGSTLEVIAPGWLNRGKGPDFTEARLMIGGEERWGDVEVHLSEADWHAHGHGADPQFERVILHVVLRKRSGGRAAATPGSGVAIPVFDAQPFLSQELLQWLGDPEESLRRYDALPGRCGLRAAMGEAEQVAGVIAHAAEVRARAKAERVLSLLAEKEDAQVLFELLLRYLGYRPYAEVFVQLGRAFPLAVLEPLLALDYPQARTAVLARWFGALGLLREEQPGWLDPANGPEYRQLWQHWRELNRPPMVEELARGGGRPWNAPERRLVGLFHHLYRMSEGGWMKNWLALLTRLDALRDDPQLKARTAEELAEAFSTPGWELWRNRVSFSRPALKQSAQLVGKDRVTVLMANAVLPFFLAWARSRGDVELEKLLYRLFLILPPEAPNHRVRFMEKRLLPFMPLPRSLRLHQGLLQIHEDFCTRFSQGCERCGFPDFLPRGVSPRPSDPSR